MRREVEGGSVISKTQENEQKVLDRWLMIGV